MFWLDHHMSGWGQVGMAIGMVFFWALIIVGFIVLVLHTAAASPARTVTASRSYSDYETPEQLLAARFARGEIDETEYRQRLEVLRGTPRH